LTILQAKIGQNRHFLPFFAEKRPSPLRRQPVGPHLREFRTARADGPDGRMAGIASLLRVPGGRCEQKIRAADLPISQKRGEFQLIVCLNKTNIKKINKKINFWLDISSAVKYVFQRAR